MEENIIKKITSDFFYKYTKNIRFDFLKFTNNSDYKVLKNMLMTSKKTQKNKNFTHFIPNDTHTHFSIVLSKKDLIHLKNK